MKYSDKRIIETIWETLYLTFVLVESHTKTKHVIIVNTNHDEAIGEIKWFSRWRQYCFFPYNDTVWNTGCMSDVGVMIKKLMEERKNN